VLETLFKSGKWRLLSRTEIFSQRFARLSGTVVSWGCVQAEAREKQISRNFFCLQNLTHTWLPGAGVQFEFITAGLPEDFRKEWLARIKPKYPWQFEVGI